MCIRDRESTARGVALLAGLQSGVIPTLDNLYEQRRSGATLFSPDMSPDQRSGWRRSWTDAVSRSLNWHD